MSEPRVMQHVVDRDILRRLAPAAVLAIALCTLGYLTFKRLLDKLPENYRLNAEINHRSALALFVGLASVVLVSQLPGTLDYYRTVVGEGAGAAARAAVVRDSINAETFGLKSHHFRLLFLLLPLFLNLVLVSNALRQGAWWKPPILVIFQVLLFLYNGERAPVAWYCLGLIYVLLTFGVSSWKWFLPAIIVVLISTVLMFFYGPSSLRLMADRTIFGSATVSYYVLKLFPMQHGFLDGAALGRFSFGDASPFDLNLFLWRNIFPASYFSHLSGTATGAVWAQGYANFGWLGAAAFAYIFGAIMALAHTATLRLFRSDTMIAMVAVLVFHYASSGESGLDRFVIDFYLVGLLAVALLLCLIGRGGTFTR